jgi:hypothetical protein
MKFSLSFAWHYDPRGIIAETRSRNKISPYAHVSKPEIEEFMNQTMGGKHSTRHRTTTSSYQYFTDHYSSGTSREEAHERGISLSH